MGIHFIPERCQQYVHTWWGSVDRPSLPLVVRYHERRLPKELSTRASQEGEANILRPGPLSHHVGLSCMAPPNS